MNTTSGLHFLVSLSDDYEQLSENVGYISEIYSNKNTEEGSENDTNTQEIFKVPRKKHKNVKMWKRNIRKQKRLQGVTYTGHNNVERAARPLLPSPCKEKSHHNCNTVTENERIQIYKDFRNLKSIDDQRQFVLNHIEQKQKKRTTRNIQNSRKMYTYIYELSVNDVRKRVCREFFMATLNISDSYIRITLKKRTPEGVEKDKRGLHTPHNKLSSVTEQQIRNHILSFPMVELSDSQSNSNKKYLDSTLSISAMHRFYKEKCLFENIKSVCLEKYRQIFNQCNLEFFKPIKEPIDEVMTEEKKNKEKYNSQHRILEKKNLVKKSRKKDTKRTLSINETNLKDLLKMCNNLSDSKVHNKFYKYLKSSNKNQDYLHKRPEGEEAGD